MNAMTATVTPIKQPDPAIEQARALAGARAIFTVKLALEADLARAKSVWKDQLTDATKTYREILRDEDVTQNVIAKRAKELYFEAREGLAKHDKILDDAKADKATRTKRIASFDLAFREMMGVGRDADADQQDMFAGDGTVIGMRWASKETQEICYSALLKLDKDGVLDSFQIALLADLGQTGADTIDLGLDAAAAIEADVEGEHPEADSDDDIAPEDVPF